MFLKTNLGYLFQIALKNMQLLLRTSMSLELIEKGLDTATAEAISASNCMFLGRPLVPVIACF